MFLKRERPETDNLKEKIWLRNETSMYIITIKYNFCISPRVLLFSCYTVVLGPIGREKQNFTSFLFGRNKNHQENHNILDETLALLFYIKEFLSVWVSSPTYKE